MSALPEDAAAPFAPEKLAARLGSSQCAVDAAEFILSGGKFLRPALTLAVCRALRRGARGNGAKQPGAAESAMVAVECFHRASLLHDDIQDGSPERYGKPCVHAALGVPRAIALGDWLVARGYALLSGLQCAEEAVRAACAHHAGMCEGQARELARAPATPAEALEIARLKTGSGFALAAALGAITGGAAEFADAAGEFGFAYGTAFQLADDEADGDSPLAACGLDGAERAAIAARALEEAGSAARAAGDAALSDALLEFLEPLARRM